MLMTILKSLYICVVSIYQVILLVYYLNLYFSQYCHNLKLDCIIVDWILE